MRPITTVSRSNGRVCTLEIPVFWHLRRDDALGLSRGCSDREPWPGAAPGSENWSHKEKVDVNTPIGRVVFNVTTPTLTAFLPDRSKATGTGVVIAPGGAFVALAMDLEGNDVASRFEERGVTAFVLKYRIMEKKSEGVPTNVNFDEASKYGIADGIQALKIVRLHVRSGLSRLTGVGFMGFSAGAMVTSGVLLRSEAVTRPNFVGLIYGGPFGIMPSIPTGLPPIFMAWAQDHLVVPIAKFHDALTAAGAKPETHIYSAGGHGFGMQKHGTTSDHRIEQFYWWLEAQGLTKATAR